MFFRRKETDSQNNQRKKYVQATHICILDVVFFLFSHVFSYLPAHRRRMTTIRSPRGGGRAILVGTTTTTSTA